jgi:hypothetical protein
MSRVIDLIVQFTEKAYQSRKETVQHMYGVNESESKSDQTDSN